MCPGSKVAIGGGASLPGNSTTFTSITESKPWGGSPARGWQASGTTLVVQNNGQPVGGNFLTIANPAIPAVYAICANAAP
jgi:hypothetical protein